MGLSFSWETLAVFLFKIFLNIYYCKNNMHSYQNKKIPILILKRIKVIHIFLHCSGSWKMLLILQRPDRQIGIFKCTEDKDFPLD